jgi:hypothetical protein
VGRRVACGLFDPHQARSIGPSEFSTSRQRAPFAALPDPAGKYICSGSLIPSAQACCLLTLLAVPLQAVFVLLPLTATRTVLSRVVSDPRARHRALLRREASQAGVFAPSRARERKAAWKASSSTGRSWSSSLRAPCGGRAVFGAHWRQRTGVALARGQAALVSSAVDKGRCHSKEIRGRRGASAEFSTTDCRPCAPLE